jgi:hypothetical protein
LLLLGVLTAVDVDIARGTVTESSGGVESDIQLAKAKIGIGELSERWHNLTQTIQHKLGSILNNFVILALGLYWLVAPIYFS